MRILALEFSSTQRSVAVVQTPSSGHLPGKDGPVCDSPKASRPLSTTASEVIETGTRAGSPFAMIETALRQAQLEREQIECLVVGIGPGSYNGIRLAIAIAQGWQLARVPPLHLLGISSAAAVAAQAAEEGIRSRVAVVIDAQRGEFYLGTFEPGSSGSCRELEELALVSRQEIEKHAAKGCRIIGPEVTQWFPDGQIVFPRAATLGRLALGRTDFVSGDKLEPIYLRETTFVKATPPRNW